MISSFRWNYFLLLGSQPILRSNLFVDFCHLSRRDSLNLPKILSLPIVSRFLMSPVNMDANAFEWKQHLGFFLDNCLSPLQSGDNNIIKAAIYFHRSKHRKKLKKLNDGRLFYSVPMPALPPNLTNLDLILCTVGDSHYQTFNPNSPLSPPRLCWHECARRCREACCARSKSNAIFFSKGDCSSLTDCHVVLKYLWKLFNFFNFKSKGKGDEAGGLVVWENWCGDKS